MKHPALVRAFAVVLALVSALTLLSGAVSIRKAKKDNQNALRQEETLAGQMERASTLLDSTQQVQQEYDALTETLGRERDDYEKASAEYKKDLNEYTLSRVGLILGRDALGQADAAMRQGLGQFEAGRSAVEQGRAAFEGIFTLYLKAREGLDRGWELWQEGINRLSLEEEAQQDILRAEDALRLTQLAREGTAALKELAVTARDQTPEDQSKAAETVLTMLQSIQSLSGMGVQDIRSMSYAVGEKLYESARALALDRMEAGTPEAEAFAAADAFVRQRLDLGYGELEAWLQENADGARNTASPLPTLELSEEQVKLLLDYLPHDREMLEEAISLLEETDGDLAAHEQEIRENPEALSAPELLLALLQLNLEAADRLMNLFEPKILAAKELIDQISAQMTAAEAMLRAGQQAIREGWDSLAQTERELPEKAEALKARKQALEQRYRTLSEREERAETIEELFSRYRAARAVLMSYDEIADRVKEGTDLIESARQELETRRQNNENEYRLRMRMCVLMLCGGAFGLLGAMGGFEKPRIKPLWLPLTLAVLLTGAGEVQSLLLGRGLWYTAIFTAITGAAMLPLTFRNSK